jgi:hypothetical protein
MYLKLSTDESTAKSALPGSSNYDASFSCAKPTGKNTTGLATVTFNNILPNTTYYITFYGTGVNYVNIGPNDDLYNPNHYAFKAEYTYAAYTPVGAPKIDIIDNYNNSFTINVTNGADGINNLATGVSNLFYKFPDRDNTNISFNSGDTIKFTPKDNEPTIPVVVNATTNGERGDAASGSAQAQIRQYIAPPPPEEITIADSESKLTLKKPWKVSWKPVEPTNEYSKICGYAVFLWLKQSGVLIPKSLGSTSIESWPEDADTIYYEYCPSDDVINKYNIKPGDQIVWQIYAYTRYGLNNDSKDMLYDKLNNYSAAYTIENASIVHVKVNGEYREGQVYVKVGNEWREAESVYVKADGVWHESE